MTISSLVTPCAKNPVAIDSWSRRNAVSTRRRTRLFAPSAPITNAARRLPPVVSRHAPLAPPVPHPQSQRQCARRTLARRTLARRTLTRCMSHTERSHVPTLALSHPRIPPSHPRHPALAPSTLALSHVAPSTSPPA